MIRVAVVEDDPSYTRQLKRYIHDYGEKHDLQFQVSTYSDGLDIVESYSAAFDIIFMDIEMRHMDGMQAARRIRKYDKDVIIIFITNLPQFSIQGYEVEAMDYVLKPINQFAFAQELQKALKKIGERSAFYLHILKDNGMVRLNAAEIYFIESQGHNVIVHARQGDYSNRDSIKNLEDKLRGQRFSRCNSGLLVNLAWVEQVEKNTVVVSGVSLPISRSRKKEFMEDLADYVGGNW